jgi:hypothetical protein
VGERVEYAHVRQQDGRKVAINVTGPDGSPLMDDPSCGNPPRWPRREEDGGDQVFARHTFLHVTIVKSMEKLRPFETSKAAVLGSLGNERGRGLFRRRLCRCAIQHLLFKAKKRPV